MRLELVERLNKELDQAERSGVEIGGAFLGALPSQASPTLRLDELVLIPGSTVSREFTLDAGQAKHLTDMSAEAFSAGRPFAGFFRSHLRTTAMAPTPTDVALLFPQFPDGLFALLLVGAAANSRPRQAAFFLAMGGQLPTLPSSPPFALDESIFQSLREVPAEATEDLRNFNFANTATRKSMPWPALLSLALLAFMISAWTLGGRVSQFFRPVSNQIDLSVMKTGSDLKITWDHSAPVLNRASGATMVITDGTSHRELKLNADDLKLGQIYYERLTKKVSVVISLDGPGRVPVQTFDWTSD